MEETEILRLEELKKYLQIDFDALTEFKQITNLASQLCEAPISLITLLDENINWIKVSSGIDQKESPREISFCQYAIQQDELLIIKDATKDSRFDANPLVQEMPGVRFYAGAPLVLSNGYKLGTLCLFDLKPNDLTELQQTALLALSRQVVYLMELKMNQQELLSKVKEVEEKNETLRQIAQFQSHEIRQPLSSIVGLVNLVRNSIADVDESWLEMISLTTDILDAKINAIVNESMGNKDHKMMHFNQVVEQIEDYAILLLDSNGNIENWNVGAEIIKGYTSAEIVGKSFSNFYTQEDQERALPFVLLDEARKSKVARNVGWRVRKDGTQFWASVVITAIQNESGEVIGFLKVTRDLTSSMEAQNSLGISEEINRRMIDEIEDYAIVLLDTGGIIIKWNKGSQKIKGYTAREALGKHFSIFFGQQDIDDDFPYRLLEQARVKGRSYTEGWRMRKDKSKFWGSVVLTAIHDNLGAVIGFIKITKEIKEVSLS